MIASLLEKFSARPLGPGQLFAGLILGVLVLSVALWALFSPRWESRRALSKCFAMSLWLHILLAGLATTVNIVVPMPREFPLEKAIEISLVDTQPEETHPPKLSGQQLGEIVPTMLPLHDMPTKSTIALELPRPEVAAFSPAGTMPRNLISPISPSFNPMPYSGPLIPQEAGPQDSQWEDRSESSDPAWPSEPENLELVPAYEELEGHLEPPSENMQLEQPERPITSILLAQVPGERARASPVSSEVDFSMSSRESPRLPSKGRTQFPLDQQPEGLPLSVVEEVIRSAAGPAVDEEELASLNDQAPSPVYDDVPFPNSHDDPLIFVTPEPNSGLRTRRVPGPSQREALLEVTVPHDGTRERPLLPEKTLDQSQLSRNELIPWWSAPRGGEAWEVPAPYRWRIAPNRQALARARGATPATDLAVDRGLQWLARNQDPEGRWNPGRHEAGIERFVQGRDRQGTGKDADTAITGLALLAFLGAGYTHHDGPYQEPIHRGLEFLIRSQTPDGSLAGNAGYFSAMYCHAIALLALSEAYALTGSPELREPIARGAAFSIRAQDPHSGGWRYRPGDPGDTSLFGWHLLALKSAEFGGLRIPPLVYERARMFLASVSTGRASGLAAYRPTERPSPAMTAEALACRLFLAPPLSETSVHEGVQYILQNLPGSGPPNFYYWYYATIALAQVGGTPWDTWNRALRDTLIGMQRRDKPWEGSWDPSCVWGGYGGRVYTTALAILCLEAYYRYLPLLQHEPERNTHTYEGSPNKE